MRIENGFRVEVPVGTAWDVLLDIEQVVPCMPGAELHSLDGDTFTGAVRVKLGAMRAEYAGTARLQEVAEDDRRIVMRAEGTELHGKGRATATVTAVLIPDGAAATDVRVVTELNITGPVAQFGRGVVQSVATTLMGEFVTALEQEVLTDRPEPA